MTENRADTSRARVVALLGVLLDDDALYELLQKLTLIACHSIRTSKAASITLVENGRYRTSSSTGPTALAIDEAQYEANDGPCLHAIRTSAQLAIAVRNEHDRWPDFAERARAEGISAVLSTPLEGPGDRAVGALNIYANDGAGFDDHDRQTADLVAEQASILVQRSLALLGSTRLNAQLQEAVATREIIGEAKGILMETQVCTRDQAFDILRRASQRENRKLRELAEELVLKVEARADGSGQKG